MAAGTTTTTTQLVIIKIIKKQHFVQRKWFDFCYLKLIVDDIGDDATTTSKMTSTMSHEMASHVEATAPPNIYFDSKMCFCVRMSAIRSTHTLVRASCTHPSNKFTFLVVMTWRRGGGGDDDDDSSGENRALSRQLKQKRPTNRKMWKEC